MTLFAKWAANSNNVIFNSNNGTGEWKAQNIFSGAPTPLRPNSFARSGYIFAGWSTQANGGAVTYNNNQSVTITAGMTLWAQWRR
jgi:uncharacterized repeat protein (TIGR02543 family)